MNSYNDWMDPLYLNELLTEEEKLATKVGGNSVGGIIDFDLNDDKARKKNLSKMEKDVGKYFYDPRDGRYKLLVKEILY